MLLAPCQSPQSRTNIGFTKVQSHYSHRHMIDCSRQQFAQATTLESQSFETHNQGKHVACAALLHHACHPHASDLQQPTPIQETREPITNTLNRAHGDHGTTLTFPPPIASIQRSVCSNEKAGQHAMTDLYAEMCDNMRLCECLLGCRCKACLMPVHPHAAINLLQPQEVRERLE